MSRRRSQYEEEAYSYFIQEYDRLKKLNAPYRDKFDEYDEYYSGYINKNKYPMTYNGSYNKVLPIIYQILENMLSHLYRGPEIIGVRPKRMADIQSADRIAGLLNTQFGNLNSIDRDGGSYVMMQLYILSALIFGKGIVKAYWHQEEGTRPFRHYERIPIFDFDALGRPQVVGMEEIDEVIEEQRLVYDGPYIENILPKLFLPDPEYRSIQKMPCVAHVYKQSLDWILKNADKDIFGNVDNIGKLGTLLRGGSNDVDDFLVKRLEIENINTHEEIHTDYHTAQNIEILDMYGKYSLEGPVINLDRGVTFKGREEEVVCTIANQDTILRLEPVPYGRKPFFDVGAHINVNGFWDTGVVELIKDIQESYNMISNLRNQVAMNKVNPMIQVLMDSEIDPNFLYFRPYGFIPLTSHDDIKILETPDFSAETFNQHIAFFDKMIHEMTGIHPYSMGVTPPRQEHVGTMYSIQSVGASRMRLLMMTMDHTGFRPLLEYIMLMNTYNLPIGTEFRTFKKDGRAEFGVLDPNDIHPDYDFEVRYASMEPSLDKPMRLQNLMQLAQIFQQHPLVNHYEFLRAVLEMTDMVDADRFLIPQEQADARQAEEIQAGYMEEIVRTRHDDSVRREQNLNELVKTMIKSK